MPNSRFDQREGVPYGTCMSCEQSFDSQAEAQHHMKATMDGNSSHRVRITNADRPHRIENEVGFKVRDAIDDGIRELDELVDRDEVTADEVRTALNWYPDFREAWDEYMEESR